MNYSYSQDYQQIEQQQESLSQSPQQTPINNNQEKFIRFSQQQFSQIAIQENQPQNDIFIYTDKQNQRLIVIDQMYISLDKLYQSSTWSRQQQKMFLKKLEQKLQQIWSQILHLVVQMKGLQFVKEYWRLEFNLYEYNKNYGEKMKYCSVKRDKIPQQITVIYLPGLKQIHLKNCQINNIESLTFINAPQLTQIQLKKNNIFKNVSSLNYNSSDCKKIQLLTYKTFIEEILSTFQSSQGIIFNSRLEFQESVSRFYLRNCWQKKCVIYMLIVSILTQVPVLKGQCNFSISKSLIMFIQEIKIFYFLLIKNDN